MLKEDYEEILKEANIDSRHLEKIISFYEVSVRTLGVSDKVYDLCCGNGLFGFYFALENPKSEVIQVDIRKSNKYKKIMREFSVRNVRFFEKNIFDLKNLNGEIYALHACGNLSERVISLALENMSSFSIMPCCQKESYKIDKSLRRAKEEGYEVIIDFVNSRYTKKNKVIIGLSHM